MPSVTRRRRTRQRTRWWCRPQSLHRRQVPAPVPVRERRAAAVMPLLVARAGCTLRRVTCRHPAYLRLPLHRRVVARSSLAMPREAGGGAAVWRLTAARVTAGRHQHVAAAAAAAAAVPARCLRSVTRCRWRTRRRRTRPWTAAAPCRRRTCTAPRTTTTCCCSTLRRRGVTPTRRAAW